MEHMLFGDQNDIRKGDIAGPAEFPCKFLKIHGFYTSSKVKFGVFFPQYALTNNKCIYYVLREFHFGSYRFS